MNRRALVAVGLLVAVVVGASQPVRAETQQSVALDAEAAPGVTYADLVRQIVPDLAEAQGGYSGSRLIELRHAAADYGGATPERFPLASVPVVAFGAADSRFALMLIDLGSYADFAEGLAPLALFDLSGRPRLADAVDVAFDRHTGFAETGLSPERDGLVVTTSTHFNSNQAYVTHAVLSLDKGRLELVDTVSTFNEQSCAGVSTQRPAFSSAGPDAFVVTVAIETVPGEEECGEPRLEATRRTISVTYRRAAPGGKFVPDSDALDVLATANQGRF